MSELINPGNTPQVYSDDGKVIGAGERIELDALDGTGEAATAAGRLTLEEPRPEAETDGEQDTSEQASGDADSGVTTARRSRKGGDRVP